MEAAEDDGPESKISSKNRDMDRSKGAYSAGFNDHDPNASMLNKSGTTAKDDDSLA